MGFLRTTLHGFPGRLVQKHSARRSARPPSTVYLDGATPKPRTIVAVGDERLVEACDVSTVELKTTARRGRRSRLRSRSSERAPDACCSTKRADK